MDGIIKIIQRTWNRITSEEHLFSQRNIVEKFEPILHCTQLL